MLLYEAGEPLRFDDQAIRVGTKGVLRVMAELGMRRKRPKADVEAPVEINKTTWVRARRSGIFRAEIELGQRVSKKDRLGLIADAMGENQIVVKSSQAGLVIGLTKNPLVNQGDAIVHVGIPTTSARDSNG
jgi:hypothetical protein